MDFLDLDTGSSPASLSGSGSFEASPGSDPAAVGATPPAPDLLFTAEAAAARLRLRASTLRTWARSGKVPHRRLGRALRFSEADLRQIVEAAARPAAAPAGWVPVPMRKHRSPRRREASRARAP